MIRGLLAPLSADEIGHYGMKTCNAVRAYQRNQNIYPAPDSVGPLTRGALNQEFAI
jgi:peptidoglycan hydrolase-like protein with peptidoglycan-binding domain